MICFTKLKYIKKEKDTLLFLIQEKESEAKGIPKMTKKLPTQQLRRRPQGTASSLKQTGAGQMKDFFDKVKLMVHLNCLNRRDEHITGFTWS